MKLAALICSIATAIVPAAQAQTTHQHGANEKPQKPAALRSGLGNYHKEITTSSREAQAFFDDKIDIHHIFPEKWCITTGLEPSTYNRVINKTPLSASTNRQIGGRAPSKYLPAIEKAAGIGAPRMDEILQLHCIAPDRLRADRFWGFYGARAEALLLRIEAATGKNIARQPELFAAGVVAEMYDEGPEEWDDEEPLEEAAS